MDLHLEEGDGEREMGRGGEGGQGEGGEKEEKEGGSMGGEQREVRLLT